MDILNTDYSWGSYYTPRHRMNATDTGKHWVDLSRIFTQLSMYLIRRIFEKLNHSSRKKLILQKVTAWVPQFRKNI